MRTLVPQDLKVSQNGGRRYGSRGLRSRSNFMISHKPPDGAPMTVLTDETHSEQQLLLGRPPPQFCTSRTTVHLDVKELDNKLRAFM
ncbi:hypothetical protein SMACR_03467 [Sordaria macrospora]|uniref:WGS project CABT00000000 data, contig 2.10 n=2 Tax=Sordaria macrospora TaxID=5147 RepID=F7VW89_SORMK|nr:uncharacterized protein SMAC_03467 [Sordaria macrospora k-hell]KAA8633007.1 hypothetical protein SMACR_03467 [Sordaria macrospora]WPJ66572.1 hypothetical protein SMAC4_03467 [Sordaria macrospora]CCC09911.1 unnamed protein product [Sordaria macrospora k-hell]